MQQLALVGVLVRLFALYAGFTVLQSLVFASTSTEHWAPGSSDWWMVMVLLVALLLAIVLTWVFNLSIAQRLLAGRGDRALNLEGVGALEAALYACFGLWLVYAGVAAISRAALMYLVYVPSDTQTMGQLVQSLGVEGIASVAQILVGVFLMLRSQGLARLVQKLRGT